MGATNKKSKKSAGFAKRKRQTKRPLQRTGKHKKSAPHVKNLAALVSKDKGDRRAMPSNAHAEGAERGAGAKTPTRRRDDGEEIPCVCRRRVRCRGSRDPQCEKATAVHDAQRRDLRSTQMLLPVARQGPDRETRPTAVA